MVLAFGPQILTKDLSSSKISHFYTIQKETLKEKANSSVDVNEIDGFVNKFNSLLLQMHDLHFEHSMDETAKKSYYQKMHDLVLSVKALDTKGEKQNLNAINEFNKELYDLVLKVIDDGDFPLTVGGDHIVAIASSLASIKKHQNLGIIWFDSHADFNTYPTSVTGNLHGLPLAVATHYEKSILANFHTGPFYNPKNTVIVGGRDIDPWEWNNVLDSGVTVFSTEDIYNQGIQAVCKKAFEIANNRY